MQRSMMWWFHYNRMVRDTLMWTRACCVLTTRARVRKVARNNGPRSAGGPATRIRQVEEVRLAFRGRTPAGLVQAAQAEPIRYTVGREALTGRFLSTNDIGA